MREALLWTLITYPTATLDRVSEMKDTMERRPPSGTIYMDQRTRAPIVYIIQHKAITGNNQDL